MFTVGLLHTRGHDQALFHYLRTEPTARHSEGSYSMPFHDGTMR